MKHITLSLVLLISTPLIAMDSTKEAEAKLPTESVERPSIFASRGEDNPYPSNPLHSSATDLRSQFARASNPDSSRSSNPLHGMPGHRCGFEEVLRSVGSSPSGMPRPEIAALLDGLGLGGGLDSLFGGPAMVMSMSVKEQTPLMKLMNNADSIHDILLKASPIFIAWIKNPNTNNVYTALDAPTKDLRSKINTQDDLLTEDLEQKFGSTQAFKRLSALASGIQTLYQKLGKEKKDFIETFTLEQPEHSVNNFVRTFIPLQDGFEKIVNLCE